MATTLEHLLNLKIPEVRQTYTEKDVILYALGVGIGDEPTDEGQLAFVYEKGLKTLPTFPAVLAAMRIRDMNLGLNYLKMVHGEQSIKVHKQPPVQGAVLARTRVANVLDKGSDKGAIVVVERELFDDANGDHLSTLAMTIFARGDGGIGSTVDSLPVPHPIPERDADTVCHLKTLPQAALIYRLCGDTNPLHAEPAVARSAGFDRPILHGLATYGVIGHALIKGICNYDPTKVLSLSGRFTGPVYPGEELEVSLWRDGNVVSIRAAVPSRNSIVFANGRAELMGTL